MSDSFLENKYLAKTLAVSVFPTPVGPKNKKTPIGLSFLFNPALDPLHCF